MIISEDVTLWLRKSFKYLIKMLVEIVIHGDNLKVLLIDMVQLQMFNIFLKIVTHKKNDIC